ncbi:large ribosomal subunit protein mL37 [Ascaphus truei]|uniref:large ribosomal subunit protein mL37 n=1 Tax=Ascaphus truei TaxID=8439 RepID=UPI003F59217C
MAAPCCVRMSGLMLTRRVIPGSRRLSVSAPLRRRKEPLVYKMKEPPEIPGLQRVTFAERMYFVPWLARPHFPPWTRDWQDPQHYRSPDQAHMPLHRERPAYVFNQKCRLLEGVKQALWLTKTKLIEGLPNRILSICEDLQYQIPNQDERVQNVISHACLWNSTGDQPVREEFCPTLLQDLLHLCKTQNSKYPLLFQRGFTEKYRLAASWYRESRIYQVRGINGFLLSARTELAPLASAQEIQATVDHNLESLYPISPAIDLQEVNVYEEKNDSGFRAGYPFSHPHTVYLTNSCNTRAKFLPDQLRAKMIMFAFGNALAKARILFGEDTKVLPHPVLVQSVGTDGQFFQFMVLQLNTLDFDSNDGVKNIVWIDSDQPLYESAACVPKLRRKVVVVPAGICGYQPATFMKFWAMYLHGAV